MKKIVITAKIILLFFVIESNAQEKTTVEYMPTPQTKKFEGSWVSEIGSAKLSIKLINYEKFLIKDVNAYADVIEGSISYKKNGKIIYQKEKAIISGRTGPSMPYELWGIFKDPKGRGGKIILTFNDTKDTNTLNLRLIPRNHLDSSKYPKIIIPEIIILKRVK